MGFQDSYQRALNIATSPRHMGEAALYTPKNPIEGFVPIEIFGVPNREAIEIILGEMTTSRSRRATYGVNLVALEEKEVVPKEGDLLLLRNINFKIKEVIPDGEGGASLVLLKSA